MFGAEMNHAEAPATPAAAVIETKPVAPAPQPKMADPGGQPESAIADVSPVNEAISDAGEELVANRRNRGKVASTWKDIEGLNDTLKVKETVKGNIWLKPDYQQLIDDGMQPLVAHIFKQAYDSIAAKPAVSARVKTGDAHLQSYITGLQRIEQGLLQWSQDKHALQAWAKRNIRTTGAMLGQRVDLSTLAGAGEGPMLLEYVYPQGWRSHTDELRIVGGNKVLGALQPGYEEIKRAMKAIDDGWPNKREAWQIQGYKVLEEAKASVDLNPYNQKYAVSVGRYYIGTHGSEEEAMQAAAAIKPFVLVGKRGFIDSFDSHELAVDAAKEKTKGATGKNVQDLDKGYNVADAERVGMSRRMEGEDISSERLMEEFGLRGVNFGNWMKTSSARTEAQLHLNHAYDALHDLADILDVPPKALSLGGMLGLAFGAQGHGGANAAHFVPGVNEINLTRNAGAGALAHEWAHAVDHYFARQAGLDTAEVPYLSEHAQLGDTKTRHEMVDGKFVAVTTPRFGEVRPEILQAFRAVAKTMTKRAQTEEEAIAQDTAYRQRVDKNVNGWLASIRRDFTGLEVEFDSLAKRIHAGDMGGEMVALSQNTYVYPVVAQMRDLYKAKHGRVYSIDQIKGLQSNLNSQTYLRQTAEQAVGSDAKPTPERHQVTTNYLSKAVALDKDKGGKAYWSTKCELFARAFDSFVADRLETKAAKNSYLSFGVRQSPDVPTGTEREDINAAFGSLVGEFAVRETELGPALFSSGAAHAPGRSALPVPEIHAEIQRLRSHWKNMPHVFVVGDTSELPFNAPSNADGAYHDRKVYVIANAIADLGQLQKVMAHECIMHHSLEEMLGDYGFSKLHHGVQSLKAKGDETVCAIAENVRSRYGDLPADIETKEIVARAGELCLDAQGQVRVGYGFMKGVYAGVAGWLRDHGIQVPFTNTELQGILHKSSEWAKRETGMATPNRDNSLSRLSGLFVGKILNVADGVVTQKVGRTGETMLHSLADLSRSVQVGEMAEITYRNGKGSVREDGLGQDRGARR
ncbi:hypothetical protein CBP36_21450 (plasmid) [Acidovorax carolinensis]|uniref:Uncharacterized protein n=2 Tax=Acidovorax carolinensis TaxID=553814 RepID=A0A240UKG2_9BURK|nr:hypothetical protein CBP36_21450 [Acidovorax carolinensis]